MATYWKSNNPSGRNWELLTPADWIQTGFSIKLSPGEARVTDDELEAFIEEQWQMRQEERARRTLSAEEAWEKTGYSGHELDLEKRIVTIHTRPSNWRVLTSTNLNTNFYRLMLQRYNQDNNTLTETDMHNSAEFKAYIAPYLDGSLAQCYAVNTYLGIPVGLRSDDMGEASDDWHTQGTWIPQVGMQTYRKKLHVDWNEIINPPFELEQENLKLLASLNVYDESGGAVIPGPEDIIPLGIVYETPGHTVEIVWRINAHNVPSFREETQHKRMEHFDITDVPDKLSYMNSIVPAGQAALVLAYTKQFGMEQIREFSFVH